MIDATLRSKIDESAKYLRSENVVSDTDAQLRAGRFLELQFLLINGVRDLSADLLKAKSILHLTLSQVTQRVGGKNKEEREAGIKGDPDYIAAREKYEEIEADIESLQAYLRTVQDAHVFYRQLSKGEAYVKI